MAQDQDKRDVRVVLDDREALRRQLTESQQAHRVADREAKKVAPLAAEVERLKTEVEQHKGAKDRQAKENADLDTKVRELESELRDQRDLEEQIANLKNNVERANASQADAEEKLAEAQAHVAALKKQVEDQGREIKRLLKHESQTHLFLDAIEAARKLVR